MMGVWITTAALQLVPKVELKWMIVMALQTAPKLKWAAADENLAAAGRLVSLTAEVTGNNCFCPICLNVLCILCDN